MSDHNRLRIELRRAALIRRIARWQETHAYPPSHRDLMGYDTYRSVSSVAYNLRRLREQGYVMFDQEHARTVRLTAEGEELVAS